MEVYILDDLLRRIYVFDEFESLIWTERWVSHGDFELQFVSTRDLRQKFVEGVRLAMNESHYIMEVESVSDNLDDDGRKILIIRGNSLEAALDDRDAFRDTHGGGLHGYPKWTLEGTPGGIIRHIFDKTCRNSSQPEDNFPFLQTGTYFPEGNIAEPTQQITIELSPGSVYKATKELCEAYDLGFRFVRAGDDSKLYYEIYSGNDRTTSQSQLPPVVFSPSFDNLTNSRHIKTFYEYKNVAHVYHTYHMLKVYGDGVHPNISGFDRKILVMDVSDEIEIPERPYVIPEEHEVAIRAIARDPRVGEDYNEQLTRILRKEVITDPSVETLVDWIRGLDFTTTGSDGKVLEPLQLIYADYLLAEIVRSYDYDQIEKPWILEQMRQKGREALARTRNLEALDGELSETSSYRYGIDYQLGDIVDMRTSDNVTNRMRVGEQIFVSDSEGERRYPTLMLSQFVSPGTWAGWNFNQVWNEATGTWEDLADGPEYVEPEIPDPPKNYKAFTGPVGTKLTIPTFVSPPGGQVTHPSVYDFGTMPLGGYRYWMAYTPYPGGDDSVEDPSIVVSNDGFNWVVPSGLTNPLDDQPGSPGAYNSDPYLQGFPVGDPRFPYKLSLFWRTFKPGDPNPEQLWMRTSMDGITWTPKVKYMENPISFRLLSPTVLYEYIEEEERVLDVVYGIDVGTKGPRMVRMTQDPAIGNGWVTETANIFPPLPTGRKPWHLEVRKLEDEGVYVGLLNDCDAGTTGLNGDMYIIQSTDGVNFTRSLSRVIPRTASMHDAVYKGCLLPKSDGTLDVFYSGWLQSSPSVWNIFRTTLSE